MIKALLVLICIAINTTFLQTFSNNISFVNAQASQNPFRLRISRKIIKKFAGLKDQDLL